MESEQIGVSLPLNSNNNSKMEDALSESLVIGWAQICQIFIGFIGMIGNLTCVIVLCRRSVRNNTNLLIVNQAVVDGLASTLLLAATLSDVGGIRTSMKTPVGAVIYCTVWNSLLIVFSCFAISTFNMVALSIERYLAVVHPIWYASNFKKRALGFFIASTWILGPVFQILNAFLHYETFDGQCVFEGKYGSILVLLFFWEYFIPVCVMTFSFAAIILKFRQLNKVARERGTGQLHSSRIFPIPKTSVEDSSSAGPDDKAQDEQPTTASELQRKEAGPSDCRAGNATKMTKISRTHLEVPSANNRRLSKEQIHSGMSSEEPKCEATNSHIPKAKKKHPEATNRAKLQRRNTTKVLLAMYLLYLLCWSPNQWVFLSYTLGVKVDFLSSWYMFLILFGNLNACVNPFLFALRLKVYRQEFKVMCRKCCRYA